MRGPKAVEVNIPQGVFRISIAPGDAGLRLDVFLHARFPELSRSLLKRYIAEGRIVCDAQALKPSSTLRAGQELVVELPAPPSATPLAEAISLAVLYEDDDVIVIDKSPDMVVHPGAGNAAGGTIVNALLHYTDDLSGAGGEERPGIVHRLDRETSGVLLIARNDHAHRTVAAQFKARTVRKEYLALAHGVPRATNGTIDLPIARSLTQRKKMAIRHDEQGKRSVTRWQLVRVLADRFAWFHCFPETGRTHQIRVHLKALGHPILCDTLYGREKRLFRAELEGRKPPAAAEPILARHALHASRLSITHPRTGAPLDFHAPLPPDLAALWALAVECAAQNE
ncbi:MAG: RluA family pseudouridine synthase [Planctomycetota bacterium]